MTVVAGAEDTYPQYTSEVWPGSAVWVFYRRRPERPRRGEMANGGQNRLAGGPADRRLAESPIIFQTLWHACMTMSALRTSLRPLLGTEGAQTMCQLQVCCL